MKKCFLRLSDTEPLRSILPMLQEAGYDCFLPNRALRNLLRDMKCYNVDEPNDMVQRWGAEPLEPLPEIGADDIRNMELMVDVNGGRNGPICWDRWPNLKDKVLTYFINGGEPRDTPDKGDNRTPTTPIATTAQHYRATLWCPGPHPNVEGFSCDDPPKARGYWQNTRLVGPTQEGTHWRCPWGCPTPMRRAPWLEKTFVFWPAFTRWERNRPRVAGNYAAPVSFVHNCLSWGCQAFVEPARKLGVKAYGGGNSPDGLVRHEDCFEILRSALCTVYLKGGGAVDYSILEPMAMGCPTTFHWSYVHNCRLYDLLEDGVTCLMWEDEKSMADCIERLRDPVYNRKIGEQGKDRMIELCMDKRQTPNFVDFMRRMFP